MREAERRGYQASGKRTVQSIEMIYQRERCTIAVKSHTQSAKEKFCKDQFFEHNKREILSSILPMSQNAFSHKPSSEIEHWA